ncbi:MAG: Hpt domain-containing protein [Thermodesulfobacteriota bacterium]
MQFQELAANLGLDIREFSELVQLFLETARNDILRIQASLADGDYEAIKETAHSLKGSAGNLGFSVLAAEARELEKNANNKQPHFMTERLTVLTEKLEAVEKALNDLQPS